MGSPNGASSVGDAFPRDVGNSLFAGGQDAAESEAGWADHVWLQSLDSP